MPNRVQEILNEILAHVRSEGGAYITWYAGITGDIEGRLFGAHKVPEKDHWYIWRPTSSVTVARAIEDGLHKLGFDGGPGGGDDSCVNVYCYKKTRFTDPSYP